MSNILLRRRMLMQAGGSPTPSIPEGALPFPFSVSPTKQVYFSKGNLQWSATGGTATPTTHATADGGVGEGTWRFAENQWDTVGNASMGNVYGVGGDMTVKCNNANVGQNYQGWIDIFGWGTSGYSAPPYLVSQNNSDYVNGNIPIVGTNYDWGIYNAISNGGNQPGLWRTLSVSDINYLLNTRVTLSGVRYAKGNINGIDGLFIVPDNWDTSIYTFINVNTQSDAYSNVVSVSDYHTYLLPNGVAFMKSYGVIRLNNVNPGRNDGFYWLIDNYNASSSYYYRIYSTWMAVDKNPKHFGWEVRLVMDYTD